MLRGSSLVVPEAQGQGDCKRDLVMREMAWPRGAVLEARMDTNGFLTWQECTLYFINM